MSESVSFNPVLGFLGAATAETFVGGFGFGLFQSRAGFSGCRDRSASRLMPRAIRRFNPVLGFLGAATGTLRTRRGEDLVVSIPCWVFWVPRPHCLVLSNSSATCFNPVLGFLGAATRDQGTDVYGSLQVSIPCWVFWVPRPA